MIDCNVSRVKQVATKLLIKRVRFIKQYMFLVILFLNTGIPHFLTE